MNILKRARADCDDQERCVRRDAKALDPHVERELETLSNSMETLVLTRPEHARELLRRLSKEKLTVEDIRNQVQACADEGKPEVHVRGACNHLVALHRAVVDGRKVKPANHVFRTMPFQ